MDEVKVATRYGRFAQKMMTHHLESAEIATHRTSMTLVRRQIRNSHLSASNIYRDFGVREKARKQDILHVLNMLEKMALNEMRYMDMTQEEPEGSVMANDSQLALISYDIYSASIQAINMFLDTLD